jgi:hypothetical protein
MDGKTKEFIKVRGRWEKFDLHTDSIISETRRTITVEFRGRTMTINKASHGWFVVDKDGRPIISDP